METINGVVEFRDPVVGLFSFNYCLSGGEGYGRGVLIKNIGAYFLKYDCRSDTISPIFLDDSRNVVTYKKNILGPFEKIGCELNTTSIRFLDYLLVFSGKSISPEKLYDIVCGSDCIIYDNDIKVDCREWYKSVSYADFMWGWDWDRPSYASSLEKIKCPKNYSLDLMLKTFSDNSNYIILEVVSKNYNDCFYYCKCLPAKEGELDISRCSIRDIEDSIHFGIERQRENYTEGDSMMINITSSDNSDLSLELVSLLNYNYYLNNTKNESK